ncbi:hypothetical protein TSUD_28140 [Trifolium subterraneum]|uniref:Reverse transcriptase domain-containing protein n=1 Tax=Trifolium subterraneum TaxID=3900 RepID=A0A2Z6N6X7_TRISU|nr:hypothetical protein TSUD_28140 [Trifolium subterraneum]
MSCGVTSDLLKQERCFMWQMFMRLAMMGLSRCSGTLCLRGFNRWGGRGSSRGRPSSLDHILFNRFIEDNNLIDLPLSGRKFTWFTGVGLSMSRLDRFLLSEEWCLAWPNCKHVARLRGLSDDSFMVLSANEDDWGPRPLRMLKCWRDISGYNLFVRDKWNSLQVDEWGGYVLKEKFKMIKAALKDWHTTHVQNLPGRVDSLKTRLSVLDQKGEEEVLSEAEIAELHGVTVDIHSLSVGNSPARSGLRRAVSMHFASHFKAIRMERPRLDNIQFKRLSQVDGSSLTMPFSEAEVKSAVWDYDSYKSLGPDEITFGFIKDFWAELWGDIMRFISEFHRNSKLTKVLVNGSPTDEFTFERGLRQGDPLSPFLFLLAAEGLNVLMEAVAAQNLFKGYNIGGDPRWLVFLEPVLACLKSRLSGWKSRFLSFGGHLVLLKEYRGLGVRQLREFNLTLLGKWCWRMLVDREGLWFRVLIARNRDGGELGDRGFWEHVSRRVGDGAGRDFILDLSLGRQFGCLFDLAVTKTRTVAEMWYLGWGANEELWQWRRQLRVWEEDLLRECYTVRGSYQLLTSQVTAMLDEAEKLIWHPHVPLKVSIFRGVYCVTGCPQKQIWSLEASYLWQFTFARLVVRFSKQLSAIVGQDQAFFIPMVEDDEYYVSFKLS